VRLPFPETEWVGVSSETRPGSWLSPGDSVRWLLPAGPVRRLEGAYASVLAGSAAGSIRVTLSGTDRAAPVTIVPLGADPLAWNGWSVELPATDSPGELEVSYVDTGPEAATHSLFLTEPFFRAARPGPPRAVILFLVDTLRSDHVSAYGHRLETTPRLDSFFREGLRAEKCFPSANWTLPSHASLFTSVSVARHDAGRFGNVLPESFRTLAESLSQAGYTTLAVTGGGMVDPAFGLARGFDRYFTVPGSAAAAVERSLALLREHRDEPVFLFLHTYQVHDYAPDEPAARELLGDLSALGPDWQGQITALVRAHGDDPRLPEWLRNRYDAALRSADFAFGRLVDGLEEDGRLDRTAVLFTSDHGEALCDRSIGGHCMSWGHGSPYLFEEELRVPLEIRVPWIPAARGTVSGNASLLDVAPTLLEAAGAPSPGSFEGRSLLSGSPPAGRALTTEAPPLEALAVRMDEHKLIRRTGARQTSWFDGTEYLALSVQECFDLATDPAEKNPLPSASAWGMQLREQVDRYLASGFPGALVVRLPALLTGAGERVSVRVRGRGSAPALRIFGLASRGTLSQRGTVTEIRFARPRAPVWLAFSPAEGVGALELDAEGIGPVLSAAGLPIERSSYRWSELGWPGREPLPARVALFTTRSSGERRSSMLPVPPEVLARLLSLGYLPFSSPPAALPAAPGAVEDREGEDLAPDEIRIRRVE
jgi:arylsulfatase A-like enzyme